MYNYYPAIKAEDECFHYTIAQNGTCLDFISIRFLFSLWALENIYKLNYDFLHVVGIVTIGEEKKICTVSENFLRMCESTEVNVSKLVISSKFYLPLKNI